jgi:hypothetical protein
MNPAKSILALIAASNARANAETVRCPNCPDQGWYYRLIAIHPEPEQCQFCYSEPNSVFNRVRELNARDEALKVLVEEVVRLNEVVDKLLQHTICEDAECSTCGEIVCPGDEPLHFHHDGCPICCYEEDAISRAHAILKGGAGCETHD